MATAFSLGLVGLVLISAVVLVVDISGSEAKPRVPRSDTVAASSSSDPASGIPPEQATGCPDFPTRTPELPKQEPSEITWQQFRLQWVPVSALSGPALEQGGVTSCFAHTPTGALIAAAQIVTRATLAADWRLVAEKQFVPGPATDEFIRRGEQAARNAPPVIRDDPSILQPAGFRILSYADDQAMIALLYGAPLGGAYQVGVYSLTWQDGDWRIQVSPDGKLEVLLHQPATVDEYTPWGSP